jgi:UTP-glucose-1-phosphate uridylyltransferase
MAPIILFAYKRPSHTIQLLNSLATNPEAKQSILYVYCDGARVDASIKEKENIQAVINIVKVESRFAQTKCIIRSENMGLAQSIITGVTEVLKTYNECIVLEDDLVVSPYFLHYMNDSLKRYKNNKSVGQIGGCNFFACTPELPSTFFLPIPDCLGWATWQDRWIHFEENASKLLNDINTDAKKKAVFTMDGHYNHMEVMLKNQAENNGQSWAVRWTATCVLNEWLTLYPNPSVTQHIESQDATHAGINILPPLQTNPIDFKTQPLVVLPLALELQQLGCAGKVDYNGLTKVTQEKLNNNLMKLFRRYLDKIKSSQT